MKMFRKTNIICMMQSLNISYNLQCDKENNKRKFTAFEEAFRMLNVEKVMQI